MDLPGETQREPEDLCTSVFDDSARARWMAWAGVLLPIVVFCVTCIRFLSPLPLADDYDAILLYLVHLRKLTTLGGQISAILFTQHNEYKLVWGNLITALQYKLLGHVDFMALSVIGDLQVLLIGWLLWKTFATENIRGTRRLALFVPVSLLLFQTNYAETLNWSMATFQNLGVIAFALLSLWLLGRTAPGSFAAACAAFAFAIAASGNGFFLLPVGLFFLWRQRRFRSMALWTFVFLLCASLYFHRYTLHTGNTEGVRSGLHPLFLLSLFGSFAGVKAPILRYTSVPAGVCVLAGVALMATRSFYRRNPAIAGFLAFLLITVAGISVTRGGSGYVHSLSMRYKLYADLILICLYAMRIERMLEQPREQQRRAYRLVLSVACLFFLGQTVFGARFLWLRERDLNQGLLTYRESKGTEGPLVPSAKGTPEETKAALAFNQHFRQVLRDAEAAGVYHLPKAFTSPKSNAAK